MAHKFKINKETQMSILFTSGKIGSLEIPNRLVRSATAERMADDNGQPRSTMVDFYRQLARGGVGLIITGHMFVHPSGKAHEEMTGIYNDGLIPHLKKIADAIHEDGGIAVAQINHGGMHVDGESVSDPIAPSAYRDESLNKPAREMTEGEIATLIESFGQAARRIKEAGFDGVQIHGAHGYLISQFLSPAVNKRDDKWGGNIFGRASFLKEVYHAVREQVGNQFPILIKLAMKDGVDGGLDFEDSLEVVKLCEEIGIDGIEISSGFKFPSSRKGIRRETEEAYFLPFAKKARPITTLPLILVGGMRSKKVMEKVLTDGYADFVSLCRPLINDPDFPNKLRLGQKEKSDCISSNNCWAEGKGIGIACKCPIEEIQA
jgi:2,4-dienoyl-CoA reductase-like NADH-dependent reductase (Old Yellow Enzyme family)